MLDEQQRQYLEDLENQTFADRKTEFTDKLERCISKRSEWDIVCDVCDRIMENYIPDNNPDIQDLVEVTDDLYVINELQNTLKFRKSILKKSSVYWQVTSNINQAENANKRLDIEHLQNYSMDEFDVLRKANSCVSPQFVRGFGVFYMPWNPYARDSVWKNGKPEYRMIDSKKFYVDENTEDENWLDSNFFAMKSEYQLKDAEVLFPEYKDIITADTSNENEGDAENKVDMFDVYTCQYRKTFRIPTREMQIVLPMGGIQYDEVMESQYQEAFSQGLIKDVTDENGNIIHVSAENDNITFGEPIQKEVKAWFQYLYSKSHNTMLGDVSCMKDSHSFAFYLGNKFGRDPYPRSEVWYQTGSHIAMTILLNQALQQVIKMGAPNVAYFRAALKNPEDWMDNQHKMYYKAELDEQWAEEHPGLKPFEEFEHKINPELYLTIMQMIKAGIGASAGATPAATGNLPSAGLSGSGIAELKSAAGQFSNDDEENMKYFLTDIGEINMHHICNYMNFPFSIRSINSAGQEEYKTINGEEFSDMDTSYYKSQPIIVRDPETVRILKQDRAVQLNSGGKMSDLDMYEELGYSDAEGMVQRNLEQMGILEDVKLLQQFPQLRQKLHDIAISLQQQEIQNRGNAQQPQRK